MRLACPGALYLVADDLDYLLTLTRLRILDELAGPEPETPVAMPHAPHPRVKKWR